MRIWVTMLSMQKSVDAVLFVNMGDDTLHAKKVEAFLFANQGIHCTSCKESGGSKANKYYNTNKEDLVKSESCYTQQRKKSKQL